MCHCCYLFSLLFLSSFHSSTSRFAELWLNPPVYDFDIDLKLRLMSMSYSPARLERARKLFQNGTSEPILAQLAGTYDLRNRAAKRSDVLAPWYDNDQDEDYDPFTEHNEKRKRFVQGNSPDVRPRKKITTTAPPLNLATNLNTDPEVGPLSSCSSSSDSEPDSWDQYWAVHPNTDSPNSPYRFRLRGKDGVSDHSQPDTTIMAKMNPSAILSTTSLFQEPDVRGCTACEDLDMECSLATNPDPLAYPCTTCGVDELECEVTPPPKWKRSCEGCKGQHGRFCSYRYADYDHSQPCLPCVNHGFKCVAGPAKYCSLVFQSVESAKSESLSSSSLHADDIGCSDSNQNSTLSTQSL